MALVLAHETGHRIGAIRQLRWSDVDLAARKVHWRAQHEKTGYEHTTPLTNEAVFALETARTTNPGIGDAPVLPAPKDSSREVGRHATDNWWWKAENLGGMKAKPGRGWHSLRRKFASDLMDKPLKVLCDLGGWKEAKTLMDCYQRPNEDQLREALADRRRVQL